MRFRHFKSLNPDPDPTLKKSRFGFTIRICDVKYANLAQLYFKDNISLINKIYCNNELWIRILDCKCNADPVNLKNHNQDPDI